MNESSIEQIAPSATANGNQAVQKERVGVVVSAKMDKTIVVEVTRRVPHPLYKKIVKRSQRYYAHDAEGTATLGDRVSIEECRPISRTKRWRLKEILKH
ncbi:MAG: 30S ribosomal protein S17 [Candidatus Methylacidiphilales bacterium]